MGKEPVGCVRGRRIFSIEMNEMTAVMFQVSVRTFLLLIAAGCILLSLFVEPCRRREQLLEGLQSMGGEVVFDYQYGPQREWLPQSKPPGNCLLKLALGEHYCCQVVELQIVSSPGIRPRTFTDRHANEVSQLSSIRWLVLMDTSMTDTGMLTLANIKDLERLDLDGTKVTRTGLRDFRNRRPDVKVYCDN